MAVPKAPYSQSISQSRVSVVHEIGGQQVVMPEHDRQRHLRRLQIVQDGHASRGRSGTWRCLPAFRVCA